MTVDELFEREPSRWGLRGDPHVWRAMRAALRGKPLPDSYRSASELFAKTFKKIVGVELPTTRVLDTPSIYVKKFSVGSGMSDGQVSLEYWRDTAVPILLDRYAAARTGVVADPEDRFGLS